MIHGLRPGPLLFQQNPEFVWGLIASMYIGNIALLVMNMPLVPLFTSILRIPYPVLAPIIVIVSLIGVYSINNSVFDVWVMFVFGVLGYFFKKFDYPRCSDSTRAGAGRPAGEVTAPILSNVSERSQHLLH